MKCLWILLVCVGIVFCIEHDFKGFDDSILFGINWPGAQKALDNNFIEGDVPPDGETIIKNADPFTSLLPESNPETTKDVVRIKTSNKEEYECHIPELRAKETVNIEDYDGPSPINLLKPLFSQKICSYRLESYWSYEICHGRHVRQYHEEREGKQVKTQQYFLGHWSVEKQMKFEADVKAAQESKALPKTTKVEGLSLPYVEMVMDDGTLCDLSGKPRVTRVLYVCYSHGKHEVYSFKETSTCEYEIIILSPLLCDHPHFKPKEVSENAINCYPIGDAPKKPRGLLKMEVDSLKFHHQSIRLMNNEKDAKDVLAVLKVEKIEKDGETHLKFELHPLGDDEELPEDRTRPGQLLAKPPTIHDDSPVRAFLNGENCLNGGTGWWKYEFCYGKHVTQYHIDRSGEKTTVLLGKFDEDIHKDWIRDNKGKAPKPIGQRTSVSHFYSNGDVCDKTDKPRQTEVKLKCLENSSSPAQVSLYLLEPRTCHYILGVETPLICDILPLVDENGLIKQAKPVLPNKEPTAAEKELEAADSANPKGNEVPHYGND